MEIRRLKQRAKFCKNPSHQLPPSHISSPPSHIYTQLIIYQLLLLSNPQSFNHPNDIIVVITTTKYMIPAQITRTTSPDGTIEYRSDNYSSIIIYTLRLIRLAFILLNMTTILLLLPTILELTNHKAFIMTITHLTESVTAQLGSNNLYVVIKERFDPISITLFILVLILASIFRRRMITVETLRLDPRTRTCKYTSWTELGKVEQKSMSFDNSCIFLHEYVSLCQVRYLLCLCNQDSASLPSRSHTLKQLQIISKTMEAFPKGGKDYKSSSSSNPKSQLPIEYIVENCTTQDQLNKYLEGNDVGLMLPLFLPTNIFPTPT